MKESELENELAKWRAQIERALPFTGGTHTFEDVAAGVEDGRFQLWPGVVSVVVTEVIDTPQTSELNIFLAAGDMDEIERLEPVILRWGKEQGCTRATFVGRHGWLRTFATRRSGWEAVSTVFEKRL